MFRAVPLSIVKSFHCTHSNDICHTGFADSLRAGSGRPDPARKHVEFHPKNKFEEILCLWDRASSL